MIRAISAPAMASVALFAVAGFRLVPSLTRFQSTQNRILTNAAFADYIIDDIEFARANGQTLVSLTLARGEVPVVVGLALFLPEG